MHIVKGSQDKQVDVVNEKLNQKVVYDPGKKYIWTLEDKFELSGEQFGNILNAFRAVLNTPEAARILLVNHANDAIENVMKNAVEAGIVKESPE